MTLRTVGNDRLIDWAKIDNLPADTQTELNGKLDDITAWTSISIDKTDPNNPVISAVWMWIWDVVWPASSIDWDISVFDGITGKLIKNWWNTIAQVKDRANHTGTQSADTITDWTTNKAYTAIEKTKLAWIASNANVWVVPNSAITGATNTKITYDAKWLVTSWADATTADIADSLNKRYVTDANLTVIWNTSWTNSWDNATNSQYSWLATSKQDTLVSWTNIKTINWSSVLWSWDIVISWWTGAFTDLTDVPANYTWSAGKFTKVNATEDWLIFDTIPWWWDMLSTNNLSDLADIPTARNNLEVSKRFTVANVTTSVSPAVAYTLYLVDATSWNITITLPNVISWNLDEFRVILKQNTHKVTITTVWGVQLLDDAILKDIQTVNWQLYFKANWVDWYDIITDTRAYYRIVELSWAGTTDLSSSWYESWTIYHCEPWLWNTRTIIIPDSSTDCYWNFAKFLLDLEGTVVLRTLTNEKIALELQQTIIKGWFELTCFGDHYWITQDSRPKSLDSEVTFYSLSEDSLIAWYKQTSTSIEDSRYNKVTGIELVSPTITWPNILAYQTISDPWVIQGKILSWISSTTLNIRKISWESDLNFYVQIYKRTTWWFETLMWTSTVSQTISSAISATYQVETLISETDFLSTDMVVRKIYVNKVGTAVNPVAWIIVEWPTPSHTHIWVPATSIAHNILAWIQGWALWEYNHITNVQLTVLWNTSWTNTWNETPTTMWALIEWSWWSSIIWDADKIPFKYDASWLLRQITWTNFKIQLQALFAPKWSITTSWLTQNTAKLLGRNTASAGAVEEITLWTWLSFTGTTLNATGGWSTTLKHKITIPWEQIADTANYQGLYFYNDTGATITISNVAFIVWTAAAWSGAACAFNIYKSSWTAADWLNTNAVNLFTSAVDLTTNYVSATNTPNTTTVEAGRWITVRVTSSAWATTKASNAQIIITYA